MADEKTATEQDHDNAEARMNDDILQLVRRYTTQSHAGDPNTLFPGPSDGSLDPASTQFNARKWAKAFYDIRTRVSDGSPPRTAGIAFRSLNVYGFGTDTDF